MKQFNFVFQGKPVKSPTEAFLYGAVVNGGQSAALIWLAGNVQCAETLTFEEVGQLAGGN